MSVKQILCDMCNYVNLSELLFVFVQTYGVRMYNYRYGQQRQTTNIQTNQQHNNQQQQQINKIMIMIIN
jgi:hypothetical protein